MTTEHMPQVYAHFYYYGYTDEYPISGGQNEYSTSPTPCDVSDKWDSIDTYTLEEAKLLYPDATGIDDDFSQIGDEVRVYS